MRRFPVNLDPEAENDLDEIYTYVATHGGERVAEKYVEGILDYCGRLRMFPKRGTVRDDFRPGARAMGFGRSISIVFVVEENEVRVLRILYAGRQFESR